MKKRKTVENYLLQREIGRGNFGVVYYAIKLDRKDHEPKEYAVKTINKKVVDY
jgi:serine/threonine protein kinase